MGNTIKILAEKKLKPEADIYSDFLSFERCENFHIHLRNLRMIFNKEEFDTFCKSTMCALEEWKKQGKPNPDPNKSLPDYLFSSKVNPVHGERPTDFAIEVQGDLPHMPKNMIHIHYKSLRLDVSHEEFLELADLFAKAKGEFVKWKKK